MASRNKETRIKAAKEMYLSTVQQINSESEALVKAVAVFVEQCAARKAGAFYQSQEVLNAIYAEEEAVLRCPRCTSICWVWGPPDDGTSYCQDCSYTVRHMQEGDAAWCGRCNKSPKVCKCGLGA